jgi:hypothetical protein
VEGAKSEVEALGQDAAARKAQAAELLEGVRTALTSLSEKAGAVEEGLGQRIEEARDLMQDEIVTDLRDLQQAVQQSAQTLQAEMEDMVQEVEEDFGVWSEHLDEVREAVVKSFEQAGPYLAEAVSEAVDTLVTTQAEVLTQVGDATEALQDRLRDLGDAVTQAAGRLDERLQAKHGALGLTETALEQAIAKLQGVREVLASYSFVQG